MFPHLRARPLTLVRYPKGIGGAGFFQKNRAKHYPDDLIGSIERPRRGGVTVHPAAEVADALPYLANQGTLELHIPLATEDAKGKPDRLVFDLDPPEAAADLARAAAWACKALLDELGVESIPLATGGKGFHVYVALEPRVSMARAAHELASVLVHRHPELLTYEVLKDRREGRVLVDWMRNGRGATVVAPWSLRARPGAPVAVPLTWDELDATAPDTFRINDAMDRVDTLLGLAPVDPRPIVSAARRMIEGAGVELVQIDRFGRRRG